MSQVESLETKHLLNTLRLLERKPQIKFYLAVVKEVNRRSLAAHKTGRSVV